MRDFVLRGGLRYGYSEQSYALLGGASPGVPDKSWNRLLWSAGCALERLSRARALHERGVELRRSRRPRPSAARCRRAISVSRDGTGSCRTRSCPRERCRWRSRRRPAAAAGVEARRARLPESDRRRDRRQRGEPGPLADAVDQRRQGDLLRRRGGARPGRGPEVRLVRERDLHAFAHREPARRRPGRRRGLLRAQLDGERRGERCRCRAGSRSRRTCEPWAATTTARRSRAVSRSAST